MRVLTVTTSRERLTHLRKAAAQIERGRGLFLFFDIEALHNHPDLLNASWQSVSGTEEIMLSPQRNGKL